MSFRLVVGFKGKLFGLLLANRQEKNKKENPGQFRHCQQLHRVAAWRSWFAEDTFGIPAGFLVRTRSTVDR